MQEEKILVSIKSSDDNSEVSKGECRMSILDRLKENYIFAVIRGASPEEAHEIAKGAIEGGIKNIEITYTTPGATKVIEQLVREYSEDHSVIIGAGTVMGPDTALEAINAGAKFIVSPHYSEEVMVVVKEHSNYYLPGCATATEVVNAMQKGAPIIKLFPGGQLGPAFIKDIHGPIPEVELMPSGGVSLENIQQWKNMGAVSVGVGSALSQTFKKKGKQGVIEEAQKFKKALEG